MARLGRYWWPRPIRVRTAVLLLVCAAGMIFVGFKADQEPPTCGAVRMRPGDRCIMGSGSGSGASYQDVANSPAGGLLLSAGVVLALMVLARLLRPPKPTEGQIYDFESYVYWRRMELKRRYPTSPRLQRKFASQEEMVARFHRWAARQRKRKGFDDSNAR